MSHCHLSMRILLILATAFAIASCSCEPQKPIGKPSANYSLSLDQMFLKVADEVPEFGGMFIDATGVLKVHLTDVAKLGEVEDAIVATFGSAVIPEAGLQGVQADYRFKDLHAWHLAHAQVTLSEPGVHSVDIQEVTNRLRVGVETEAARLQVLAMLTDLGIPQEAVEFFTAPPLEFLLENINDTRRPFMGGQQATRNQGGGCTIGFLAVRNGVAGFVTNSHCQDVQGSFTGTIWHQAVKGDANVDGGMTNKVGRETVDPDYFFGGDCPSGKQCRRSDAAFVAREGFDGVAPAKGAFDAIALPVDYASGGKDFNTWVRVRNKEPHALCGQQVTTVGRSSGSRTGVVIETCVNVLGGEPFAFMCQNLLSIQSMNGDSGSPVFTWSSATLPQGAKPTATLYGILWGGRGGTAAYSSINFIEQELGALRTHKGEGGSNSAPAIEITGPSDGAQVGTGALAIQTYEAAVADWEDGEGCCVVTWASDVDGPLGTGKSIDHAFMAPGDRVITATATDSDGAFVTDTITVQTSNSPPHMTIQEPVAGQSFITGVPVQFQGEGWDVNEPFQSLNCNLLTWSSSHPADAAWQPTDCVVTRTFATPGIRTITLAGTDSGGLQDTDTVTIGINLPQLNSPPDVQIQIPGTNQIFPHDHVMTLTGVVTDTDGGANISYEWVVQPVGGTLLFGGVPEISIATGTAGSGQVITSSWTPNTSVIGSGGGSAVRIVLRGTDGDGTNSTSRDTTVMFPPS